MQQFPAHLMGLVRDLASAHRTQVAGDLRLIRAHRSPARLELARELCVHVGCGSENEREVA